MFKATCLLVLGLTIPLFYPAQTAVASQPHLVFTKRINSKGSPDLFTYTVRKGEHLYSILRSFHIPEQKLGQWARKVSELNPQIHDMDILYPGTQLALPQSLKPGPDQESACAEKRPGPGPIQSIPHTISAPVSASSLLSECIPHLNASQIKTYTRLFDSMNPHVSNSSQLMPGEKVFLPRPIQEKPRNSRYETFTHDLKNKNRAFTSTPVSKNKDQVIRQLRGMGFRFSRQGELIYLQGQGKWIRLNLDQTPLASSPWKSRVLFAPQAVLDAPQAKALNESGLVICPVPSDWSPRRVFTALDRTCGPYFMAWSPENPLILTLPRDHRVEIKAHSILMLKEDKERKVAVIAQSDICSGSIPGLLVGYLQQQNIKILCATPDSGFSAWKDQNVPSGHNLYTPTLTWPEFKEYLGQSGRALPGSASSMHTLQSLTGQGLLQKYPLHLSWSTSSGLNIILRLSLSGHRNEHGTTYFLSYDQSDPYLVALLNLMGYTTYMLRF
jgi:LysM repeat protein